MFAEPQIEAILRNAREIEDGLKPLERVTLSPDDQRRLKLLKASNALYDAIQTIDGLIEKFEPAKFLDAAE